MTNERAKSELMQLYGSLSEEKKKALDVAFKAMEQADNIPVMYYPQVDGITPTVVAQADGEYISRKALLEDLYKRDYTKFTHRDFVALVQYQDIVAIPPEHDGCKDCVYQDNPQDAMPCRECKQNYMDKWKAKAKPYKGMTNGEVVKAVFPDIPRTLEWHIQNVTDDDWWNSPYSPHESEG